MTPEFSEFMDARIRAMAPFLPMPALAAFYDGRFAAAFASVGGAMQKMPTVTAPWPTMPPEALARRVLSPDLMASFTKISAPDLRRLSELAAATPLGWRELVDLQVNACGLGEQMGRSRPQTGAAVSDRGDAAAAASLAITQHI